MRRWIAITCLLLAGCEGASETVLTNDDYEVPKRYAARGLALGEYHSCGLDRDDYPICWGSDPAPDEYLKVATKVPWGKFDKLSASDDYTCGLRTDGSLACAGWLYRPESPEHDLRPPPGRFLDVATAWTFACGLRIDRTVQCWGPAPGTLAVPTGTFLEISGRLHDVCGIRDNGTIVCWGTRPADKIVAPPAGSFATVAVGARFHCALDQSGAVTCWKSFVDSEIGMPPPTDRFSAIAVGSTSACGIRLDGAIVCWGEPPIDHWGNAIPQPAGGSPPFNSIAAGNNHMCAFDGGWVVCWGVNNLGQASPPSYL